MSVSANSAHGHRRRGRACSLRLLHHELIGNPITTVVTGIDRPGDCLDLGMCRRAMEARHSWDRAGILGDRAECWYSGVVAGSLVPSDVPPLPRRPT